VVLKKDVVRYNQKAEGPLAYSLKVLQSIHRTDVVKLIEMYYPKLMPYFIDCGTKNPVHHTAYVLQFMAVILIGEGEHKSSGGVDGLKVGMLAALFHDATQGLCKLPKITEAHIKERIPEIVCNQQDSDEQILKKLKRYRDDALDGRKEHMKEGAELAGKMLSQSGKKHAHKISLREIGAVKRLIECHDNPKIPLVYSNTQKTFVEDVGCKNWRDGLSGGTREEFEKWLAESGKEYFLEVDDWLLQYHHEADLLWMLTHDGIDADLARFSPGECKTREEMIENNREQHDEAGLYKTLLGRSEFSEYRFKPKDDPTAYRSKTGYELFQHLNGVL